MDIAKIVEELKTEGINKIKFAVPDIDGILRSKTISIDKFSEIAEKTIGFCDVIFGWDCNDKAYDNVEVTGWHTGYPDKFALIDPGTYRRIPWDNNTPYFLGDFSSDKSPLEICPRTLLKKIRNDADKMGYSTLFSQEFEWFNFKSESNINTPETITKGMFGYSQIQPIKNKIFFNDLFDLLHKFNIPLEGLHTETGPGVYEAAIRYDDILNASDKAILFKSAVKEIASQNGITASFMAKWNEELPGCSGHIHQTLWDKNSGHNLFYNFNNHETLNTITENYLAGLLFCLPHILPMYAPTINSYKRLRKGAWAPTTVSWGMENRTTAVRFIDGEEKSARLELRVPGSDVNPYLSMAASLASGLYGIKNNLKLSIEPTQGNAYADKSLQVLPDNLSEATKIMETSKVAISLFGETFVKHFTQTRKWEWREYQKAVTDWELKRYFEVI